MSQPVSVNIHDDVAIVRINNPPVNATSHAVRSGLRQAIHDTENDDRVKTVILMCEGRTFIAGADIREFNQPPQDPTLPDLIMDLEATQKPWIAAIHGTALGGGLEIALGCNFRIAHSGSKMGFPEVNLGLIPGAGGTVRLPRCIALENALDMITSGKPINADKACEFGLINEIYEGAPLEAALNFAKSIRISELPKPLLDQAIIEPLDQTSLEEYERVLVRKTRGQIAPLVAFATTIKGLEINPEAQMKLEREKFLELKSGSQSVALRYIFGAERSATRLNDTSDITPRPLEKIGIIGGGTMGAGIASAALLTGKKVVLIEQNADAAQNGKNNVLKTLSASLKRGIISQDRYDELIKNLVCTDTYAALSDADFIVEAVFEDIDVKKAVFEQLDHVVRDDAILASNTSYLDVNEIAEKTNDPSRVIGLHFFAPAHIMKLVEVIQTKEASKDVMATAFSLVKNMKKLPVLSGVCDGFIGNRIMSAYRKQAEYLLEDGSMPFEIDDAMKEFGFAMGIFEMQDLAGLDIGYAMRKRKAKSRDPNERYVDIADKIVEMGRLGRKSGSGFYEYADGKTPERWAKVEELIVAESARKNIDREPKSSSEIMKILLQAMAEEGQMILDEGIAQSPEAIDVVMVNGFGFPRYRGGPMFCLK